MRNGIESAAASMRNHRAQRRCLEVDALRGHERIHPLHDRVAERTLLTGEKFVADLNPETVAPRDELPLVEQADARRALRRRVGRTVAAAAPRDEFRRLLAARGHQ